MSEFAPPPPKVRVTKKQLKKIQEDYQKASALAEDLSEQEELEREKEVAKIEAKIDDEFA